jgi:hypothetical protein
LHHEPSEGALRGAAFAVREDLCGLGAELKDFIDLEGASGAHYRFRVWRDGEPHQPIGGHYVYLRDEDAGFTVLHVGETNDLSQARSAWPMALHAGATHAFTRLNVLWATRSADHEDLAARYETAAIGAPAY